MDHNAQFVEAQREFLSLDPLLTLLVDITEQPIQRLIENLSDTKIADRDFPARSGPKVDIIRLRSSQLRSLSQKMLGLIQRTMVLEVHIAKLRGELTVETSRKRYRQFVDSLSKEDIRRKICAEYPVLVQSCVDQADASVKFFREVMERVCWDWEEICLKFGIDRSSTLIDLVPGSGDSHNGGKSVCVLTFSDHRQLIYKPRSLKVDLSFQNLLEWFNVNGFELQHRTIKIVDKVDYGWTEFVSSYPCLNESDQALFYERLGQLLAIMYLTGTTDQHFENIVAAGEHPVSVDLETVFKPLLTSKRHTIADDVALSILADSVISVGILPAAVGDQAFDVSGIGRGGVTPFKVPSIEFRETDQIRVGRKQQYVKALNNVPSSVHGTLSGTDKGRIMVGFNNACRIAMEFKEALCCDDGPVSNFEGARVRIVLRSSLYYASLLSESTHPTLQRSSSRKERFYDDLWAESKFKAHLEKVCISERSQLLKGDIPYFSMEVDDLKLRGGDGTIIEGIVDKSGLDLTYDRIEFADEISVKRQSSFVRMALAIPAESRPLQSEFSFLSQAVHVGDILAQQMIEKDDTISWHSLNLSSEDSSKATYRIGIVGSDLYEGLAGTTLFFLHLAHLTQSMHFDRIARNSFRTLKFRFEEASSHWSIGGFSGLGGFVYLCSHLYKLWQDDESKAFALRAVDLLQDQIDNDTRLDIIAGSAGAICGLLSLYKNTGIEQALVAAIACGNHLIANSDRRNGFLDWSRHGIDRGFSHGTSGISWALLNLGVQSGHHEFIAASLEGLRWERSKISGSGWSRPANTKDGPQSTWCHGAAGIALSRMAMLKIYQSQDLLDDADNSVKATLASKWPESHGLCHGVLGNLETLRDAMSLWPEDDSIASKYNSVTLKLKEDLALGVYKTSLPAYQSGPGLMLGLSGVGLGLLRLFSPELIPNVLVMES